MKQVIKSKLFPYFAGGIIAGSLFNYLPIVPVISITFGLFLLIFSFQTQINHIQK